MGDFRKMAISLLECVKKYKIQDWTPFYKSPLKLVKLLKTVSPEDELELCIFVTYIISRIHEHEHVRKNKC